MKLHSRPGGSEFTVGSPLALTGAPNKPEKVSIRRQLQPTINPASHAPARNHRGVIWVVWQYVSPKIMVKVVKPVTKMTMRGVKVGMVKRLC